MENFLVINKINSGDILIISLILLIALFLLSKYEQSHINRNIKVEENINFIILEYKNHLLNIKNPFSFLISSSEILKVKVSIKEFYLNLLLSISLVILLIGTLQNNILFIYIFILGFMISRILLDNIKHNKLHIIALELLIYEKFNISINCKYPL